MYTWVLQALDGFSLCLWQLGEADGALAGSNVFALLHRLSVEPDHLLRRSIITAVGALSHPGKFQTHQQNMLCIVCCAAASFVCTCLCSLYCLDRSIKTCLQSDHRACAPHSALERKLWTSVGCVINYASLLAQNPPRIPHLQAARWSLT